MRIRCRGLTPILSLLVLALLAPVAAGDDLGSARLLVAGTELTVSPESQTVPFNTPTVVETHLEGYDTSQGVLPADLRVLADFTGPEIGGILVLETRPGEPFRIPRLSLKGEYVLDNIRLVQGDTAPGGDGGGELLAYASPRSAAVLVTQVLVTQVTSRALTLDEIRSYGIVVDDDNFRAFNFTFGFAVDGEVYDYNVPVIYSAVFGADYATGGGADSFRMLVEGPATPSAYGTGASRFRPPQMAPFTLHVASTGGGSGNFNAVGGCQSAFGCEGAAELSLPGVILFPTDVGLLNQFFSVVMVAKNDAPEGDALRIRDLTARVTLPPGLRMAQTEPPTPLGVPVPVRVPGPDGQLGTGDDLTFLIAQASGEAQVLVEGRKEGTHVVQFDLEGVLEGLPGGRIERITGQARGAVVVRDPSLGVTISHPETVRADEEYTLRLTVANTSNAPINLVTLALPPSQLSGVEVVGANEATIPELPPGESELVEFRLLPHRTGKVVASSVRSPYQVSPRFELTVGVGENGVPLSPDSIVLPELTGELPADLVRRSLALIGLGYSLATAPAAGLDAALPRMDLQAVDGKVYDLSQAGRHVRLGEELFDSAAVLAAQWNGAAGDDWEWDRLRRGTDKGGLVGDALAAVFAAEAAATSARAAFERFAATTAYLGPLAGAAAEGAGARLEISSRTSGLRLAAGGVDPERSRELPFADLYDLGSGEMAVLASPEAGGYQARLTYPGGGTADLHLLVPGAAGGLRTVSWNGVSLGAGGLAVADFASGDASFTLFVDADGDGLVDQQLAATASTLAPRPFTAVAAVQRQTEVSGHSIEVLFSHEVELGALLPLDPARFELPDNLSNGGMVAAEASLAAFNWLIHENKLAGLRNSRVVQVVFSNPVSPYVSHDLTVRDLTSVSGETVSQVTLPVTTTVSEPGGIVEGTVLGSDGQPVPFARMEVYETDARWQDGECLRHRTAATRADAAGHYRFEYVRQGVCSDVFVIRGTDPQSGRSGEAAGRIRFPGQVHTADVVMLGRGTLRGRVTYDDGTVPADLRVVAHSPVFTEAVSARIFPDGSYEATEVPVGTVTLGATDRQGSFVYQTVEIPIAGAVVERDLVILRRSSQEATGDVRGTVYEKDATTPVFNAYLALYVDGELVGVERSAYDGSFDFGTVPAGLAEIEGFDGETGLSGVRVYFDVEPDQVNEVTLLLSDERGAVEGHVYTQTAAGLVPVAGAVVWVEGTPFNTVTDGAGFYRLDGVFTGERSIHAADLTAQRETAEPVTVTDGVTAYRDLRFVEDFGDGGIVGEVLGFTGNPVPVAKVHIASSARAWWHESITDTLGRFTIPDLRPGSYELHAVSGSGDSAVGAKATVTIRFQGETPFVSLRFKKGTVRGRTVVLDELGNQVGVTSLITYRTTTVNEGLVDLAWTPKTLETDADGYFEIADALVGRYTLSVSNAFYGDKQVSGELTFHGDVAEHEIVFQENGSIGGVVLDVDGVTPVAGAVVHMRHPSFGDYDLTTDADGRFLFDLVPPAGRFPLDVEVDDGAVFRRGRVWVRYDRPGQELEVEIVLPPQGTVSGWVEDGSGFPVPGSVVTLREHSYPARELVQTADGDGYFSFTNVFVGRISLQAQAPSLGGLGGSTVVPLTTEGEEVWSLITLEGTGEVEGRVISPVDGQPVSGAKVVLYRWLGSVVDAATSDADGAFRFRLLPLGLYRVLVFDPRTGRHGAADQVPVDFNGQVSNGDVTLEIRGEVDGHLYDPDTASVIPGATVRLFSDGLARFTTFSSTDGDGFFEFLGIPEGAFDLLVHEPEGRRDARGAGSLAEEGERVTVDLYFQGTGRVVGSVLNPPGAPAGLFPSANTVIQEESRVVGATLDNPFVFDGLVVGRPLTLTAYEVGGTHRGVSYGEVTQQGEEVTVDLTMVPIGSAAVTVTDSQGTPVAGADLRLTSSGFYGRRELSASTGADGRAEFNGVGEGTLGAFVINPVNGLRGSANGQLSLEGEMVEIAVQLEDAASLRGHLLLADGATPAVDALVVVQVAGRTYRLRADVNGDFELPSLPLGSFTLFALEYFGDAGSLERHGTLSSNGESVDLGTLVLDDADPEVIAHTPASGARDLPLSTAVTVQFSEPLDRGRLAGGWFIFRKLSGATVAYTVSWADGDATAILTPNAPLANYSTYEVIVNDAYDLAGRRLKERTKIVLSTVDQVAPTLVDSLPRNGQKQVPVDANLRLTFSEPLVLESLSGSALQLTDLATGQGVTTTWQLLTGERVAIVTPQALLLTDRTYRLTVQGVRDGSGNVMTVPVNVEFDTPDTIPPSIDAVDFPAGTSFTSGDDVPVTVTASDPSGVATVTVQAGEWSFADAAAPWQLTVLAPVVTTAGDVTLTVEATDIYGNVGSATRNLQVAPHVNASAPAVSATCGQAEQTVVPGIETEFAFAATDDERLERLRLLVDGVELGRSDLVLAPEGDVSFLWTPPAGAQPGDLFQIRFEARDFAGNLGFQDLTARVATGTVLVGARSLFDVYAGQDLVLAEGTFLVREPLQVASLTVLRGAGLTNGDGYADLGLTTSGDLTLYCGSEIEPTVRSTEGPLLSLDVGGALTIETGAALNAERRGWAGGDDGHVDGYAPAGAVPSGADGGDGGGGHGGRGADGSSGGQGGGVYGSVYRPHQAGGGGAGVPDIYGGYTAGAKGGGRVEVTAAQLVLDGPILAYGDSCYAGSGAGGSVLVEAGTLSGRGSIDVSGGGGYPTACAGGTGSYSEHGAGGGGRVGLHADVLDGFDPATQVRAAGGKARYEWAAAGTTYWKLAGDVYGRLRVDQSETAADKVLVTELPALGGDTVSLFEAAGADAWVSGTAAFPSRWVGAWMVLLDASGGELGAFEVAELDAAGRLRLAAAAGASGAASYRGEYRFDRVELRGGAGLSTQDPLRVDTLDLGEAGAISGPVSVSDLEITQGRAALGSGVEADSLTVRTGAVLGAAPGTLQPLRLVVSGALTVEAGATIDGSGAGYPGGVPTGTQIGGAPAWVEGSTYSSGGSHGGRGIPAYGSIAGVPGEVYGSVYQPRLGGGGGSAQGPASYSYVGAAGGGAVEISAASLVLDGDVLSSSGAWGNCSTPHGAGGSILVQVGTLSGSGSLDASGGDATYTGCSASSAGGGGRVALYAETLDGFDAATQVRAWGGSSWYYGYAAPGTVYVQLPTDTYGSLYVDSGSTGGGADRVAWEQTVVPELGDGAVMLFEVAGDDAWVTGGAMFLPRWGGAWMALADGSGVDLGSYRVAEVDATGRALLEGAGAVAGAASYAGEYRFDRVEVHGGAGLHSASTLWTDSLEVLGDGALSGDVRISEVVLSGGVVEASPDLAAQNLRIAAGTTVVPPPGQPLILDVPGTLIVEAGATIDGSGAGYPGGVPTGTRIGGAPAWVEGSTYKSGGSHGGRGTPTSGSTAGVPGEVYGSVYEPRLGGGGGSAQGTASYSPYGRAGGSAVEIHAGTLVLEGDVVSGRGAAFGCDTPGGAGGSILLQVGTLSGAGSLDASGGDATYTGCAGSPAGGGGRVAIYAETLDGFDAATQAWAWGGSSGTYGYAAPGTVFLHLATDVYGSLYVDSGSTGGGVDRIAWESTELPALGSGAVTLFEPSGADAWVTAGDVLHDRWSGAWMVLADGSGGGLGAYRVAEVDAAGRARLEGAGALVGAATYTGEYRFDRVAVGHGARLEAVDPVRAADVETNGLGDLIGPFDVDELVVASGVAELGTIQLQDLRVAAGATLRPRGTEPLHVVATGTVTIEAGAAIDATGRGYVDGTSGHHYGYAPAGVVASEESTGGSHGGRGSDTSSYSYRAGEIYDSVYRPELGGGGGGYVQNANRDGGGVVFLEAAALVLDGEIRADGEGECYGGGAGGTVRVIADSVQGAGTVSADGGDRTCASGLGAGGGGRVAFEAGSFVGFDPVSRASARGGARPPEGDFAATGTVFYRQDGDSYGRLLVDQGAASGAVLTTTLPAIGRGVVGVAEADAGDPSDLWIEPQNPDALFGLGVVGMWLRVAGVDYPVVAQSTDRRRLLLDGGAGAVAVGDAYVGVYKLDEVTVTGRSTLQLVDGLVVTGATTLGSGSTLTAADLDAPVVVVTTPAAGTLYTAGDSVTVGANVSDASAITQVAFTIGSQTLTDIEAPWEVTLAAPVVTVEQDEEITVEATDAEGNVGVASRTVRVRPLAPGDPPAVAFACPTPGALLAAGTGLDVTVSASHDDGIEKVEFLLGDDPTVLATDTAAPYEHHFTAPAGALEGDVLTLRARARSFNGNTADATMQVAVVAGNVVSADTFLAAGDVSLDGSSVVVAGGTLTIEGPHTFRDLVVLDGAAVTHPAAQSLDLALTRDLYVACGGAVDASGRGWPQEILATDFTGGDLSEWTVTDVPGASQGPSDWHIDPSGSGYLRQNTNIILETSPDSLGSFLTWDGGAALTDYRVAVRQRSDDDDAIHLVFRYQDLDNHYRFEWLKAASKRRLQKRVNGTYVVLAEDSVPYSQYVYYEVEIVAAGPHLEVRIDGNLIFSVKDTQFATGTFGMGVGGNTPTIWDALRVTALGDGPPAVGGNHGGRRGGFDGGGRVYGSLFDPATPGAGGAGRLGTPGGGVVRLTAAGDAVLDGLLSAAGASDAGSAPLGAGGSIRLDAATISGAGSLDATGGGDAAAARQAGGGGRIALYAGTVDDGLLSRTLAAGGEASTTALTGAAGTLYVKRDAQIFGDLVLDNAGRITDALTELISAPPGVVDSLGVPAGGVDTLTDLEAAFPSSLVGAELSVDGSAAGPWVIVGHDDLGDTLSLDVSTEPLDAVPGDGYQVLYRFDDVIVRGGAQGTSLATVTSVQPPQVEAGSSWQPGYAPSVAFTSPEDGASVISGSQISFAATVDDSLGVDAVTLDFDGVAYTDTVAPWSWTVSAPLVSSTTPYEATVRATDRSGHLLTDALTLSVAPNPDPNPPQVSLGGCPASGDVVVAGVPLGLAFTATDVEQLYAWRVRVDGALVAEGTGVDATQYDGTVTWSPDVGDAPGTVYTVSVEAQDYGGTVVSAQRVVVLASGMVLSGDQDLDSTLDGSSLTLISGTFEAQEAMSLVSLTLASGARLVAPSGGSLTLSVSGELRVQCGATVDVSNLGYGGSSHYAYPGGAPAWAAGSSRDFGGSHGGAGVGWDYGGPAGEVYDSIYSPSLGGGGGSVRHSTNGATWRGGAGGGVVDLAVGSLVLNGDILARGEKRRTNGDNEASGAGGAVVVRAGSMSGGGLIDASGGDYRFYYYRAGAGGGGRVALYVDAFSGFDPVTQVRAWGGARLDSGYNASSYAAPGTVYLFQTGMTYGELRVDAGDRDQPSVAPPVTRLPTLGGDAVTVFEVSGADAWITGPDLFRPRWAGAWMVLVDGSGSELGGFRVAEIDASGRVRLEGAGTVSGAVTYYGEYRFDRVDVGENAGLIFSDPLVTDDLQSAGAAWIEGPQKLGTLEILPGAGAIYLGGDLTADSLVLRSGAVVRPADPDGIFRLHFPGSLVIESGAVLETTGEGYPGTTNRDYPGGAPSWVTGSRKDFGGSHGGVGVGWDHVGPGGDVYDSVYAPSLGGGGGAVRHSTNPSWRGGAGGGVVDVDVASLVLDGEIRALGEKRRTNGDNEASGAGGTVLVRAATVSGAGLIDASGGDYRYYYYRAGAGGGGRVALYVDDLTTFDPASQVRAWGGGRLDSGYNASSYAAPGTVYLFQPGMTYGELRVDAGDRALPAVAPPVTGLPTLGGDAVVLFEAAGADAWVTGSDVFRPRWVGAWMVLEDGVGGELGTFRVAQVDAAGRALLEGAGAVTGAAAYRGEYRFDRVDLLHGAGLVFSDPVVTPVLDSDGAAQLEGPLQVGTLELRPGSLDTRLGEGVVAGSLIVRSGTVVRPAVSQNGVLHLSFPGSLVVEAGAALDTTGEGYPGTTHRDYPGGAPSWVAGSYKDVGGSHGGAGVGWDYSGPAGEVFDSVYSPSLGGGGGAVRHSTSSSWRGGAGGGVVDLDVGSLVLDGEIRALGEKRRTNGDNEASGAGGTVFLRATTVSGSGLIDVSGGDYRYYYYRAGAGGGGRVALYVDDLTTFDPAAQVRAWGGGRLDSGYNASSYAAPGTVYLFQPGMTYGELRIDAGDRDLGVVTPPTTRLPTLGSDAVVAFEVAGADAWVTGPAAFPPRWIGAWMVLVDSGGTELGGFRVAEIDAAGRVRLEAAGTVSGAVSYRGEYRFDRVDLVNDAGLLVDDPLLTPNLQAGGSSELGGPLRPTTLDLSAGAVPTVLGQDVQPGSMVVRSGTTVVPPASQGGLLRLAFDGTLTLEAGALFDASNLGYAGSTHRDYAAAAPSGVSGSLKDAGGSHGGAGIGWDYAGPAGEVFDSPYLPSLGGGGGAVRHTTNSAWRGGAGGGVVDLDVGSLILDGELRARGEKRRTNGDNEASGAGGTIVVTAQTLSGTGTIDASGGDYHFYYYRAGAGGGGRVALYVDSLSGFDPLTQVVARGGTRSDSAYTPSAYAAPGTVFIHSSASTYGDLAVDQGGVGALTPTTTSVPAIGTGLVGVTEIDATDPADLWVEPQDSVQLFALGVTGAWLRVDGIDYRIVDQSADRRRVLLDGAAGLVSSGDSFAGVYKFDQVTARRGAVLEFLDTAEIGIVDVDADSQVITP